MELSSAGRRAAPFAATLIVCAVLFTGPGAQVEAQETISLPVTVTDDLGFGWDIQQRGDISNGTVDAYDGGHRLSIDTGLGAEPFPSFTTATVELGGDQFVIGPATFGDIEVVRKLFISPDGAFVRWIEILTNNFEVGQTVTVEIYTNLGSDSDELFTDTSTGDVAFTAADAWIVTDDSPLGGSMGEDPT